MRFFVMPNDALHRDGRGPRAGDLCRVREGVYVHGEIHACHDFRGELIIGRYRPVEGGDLVFFDNPTFKAKFYPAGTLNFVGVVEEFYYAASLGTGVQSYTAESLSQADLDELPFGIIKLRADGTILAFNKAEQELSRISHKRIVGRNFFTDIAPCTDVKAFRGRFKKFLAGDKETEDFEFTYNFRNGGTHVFIIFLRESSGVGYVLSIKAASQPAEVVA